MLYSIPQTMCSKINNVLSTKDVWLNTVMFEYKILCFVHYVLRALLNAKCVTQANIASRIIIICSIEYIYSTVSQSKKASYYVI